LQEQDIRENLDVIITETTEAQRERWRAFRPLGADLVPYLLEYYVKAGTWQARLFMVAHAVKFAKTSEAAYQLGITALSDASNVVRYEACCLLSFALREDAIPKLEELLTHRDARTVADAKAAIDAINHKNHSYFVDREHSGRFFWTLYDLDDEDPAAASYGLLDAVINAEREKARQRASAPKKNPINRLLGGDQKR
jgi:hypothetical protein